MIGVLAVPSECFKHALELETSIIPLLTALQCFFYLRISASECPAPNEKPVWPLPLKAQRALRRGGGKTKRQGMTAVTLISWTIDVYPTTNSELP